jgi:hypothetical protein
MQQTYSGQACNWDKYTSYSFIAETYDRFEFHANEEEISFFYHERDFETVHTKNTSTESNYNWTFSFNPADIEAFYSSRDSKRLLFLELVCRGGEDCIYFSGWDRKQPSGVLRFCDEDKRNRILEALMYLRQFYRPSKPSAF